MQPKRGMGPNMMLGKRPGADPTTQPPPYRERRPVLVNFSRRWTVTTDSTDFAFDERAGLLPWRYRG